MLPFLGVIYLNTDKTAFLMIKCMKFMIVIWKLF